MLTISLSQLTQMATLTAVVALGTLPAIPIQTAIFGTAQPPTEVLSATDDRGSGRLTASLQAAPLGFRGSGRLDDESEDRVRKSSFKAAYQGLLSGWASDTGVSLLAYRGSGRIAKPDQAAV